MADNKDKTVRQTSDEYCEFWCNPCSKSNKENEGVHYCLDCREALCKKCIKDHDKFDIMKNHRKTDTKAMDSLKVESNCQPREMCSFHHGKVLELYCGNHDTVVCVTCVALDHRLCKGVMFIPKVAHTIMDSTDVTKTVRQAEKSKSKYEAMKNYKESQIKQLITEKKQILEKLDNVRDELKNKVDDCVHKMITNIMSVSYDSIKTLDEDLKEITYLITNMNINITNLQSQDDNIGQMFVYVKKGQADVNAAELILEKLLISTQGKRLHFEMNGIAESFLNLDTLGETQLKDSNELSMLLEEEFSVSTDDDSKVCDINSSCFTSNGELILADFSNQCLKRFDSTFRLVDKCMLESQPLMICEVDSKQIAVSLGRAYKIQFVALDQSSMVPTGAFNIDNICRGLYKNKKTLYVALEGSYHLPCDGPGRICLYTLEGKLLRTIERDSNGIPFLKRPRCIFVDGVMIFVCDKEKGLVVLKNKGGVISNFIHRDIPSAYALCQASKNELFVCDKLRSLIRVNISDERMEEVLVLNTTLASPQSLAIHPDNRHLLCFCENSNYGKIIKIK